MRRLNRLTDLRRRRLIDGADRGQHRAIAGAVQLADVSRALLLFRALSQNHVVQQSILFGSTSRFFRGRSWRTFLL